MKPNLEKQNSYHTSPEAQVRNVNFTFKSEESYSVYNLNGLVKINNKQASNGITRRICQKEQRMERFVRSKAHISLFKLTLKHINPYKKVALTSH